MSEDHQSRGYLIARLMGHGSPATTLGSYIHCLDWLLASALAKSKRMSPDEATIKMASGLTTKTYQGWIQNSDRWEVPLTFWRQRASAVDLTLVTERSPASASPSILNLNELERTWNFLKTVYKPEATKETAGAACGIDSDLASRILERVAIWKDSVVISAADRKRPLSATYPEIALMALEGIPNLPGHEADRQVLAALAPFMQAMYSDPARKVVLATALATYMHRVWPSTWDVVFTIRNPMATKRASSWHLSILCRLPVPRQN